MEQRCGRITEKKSPAFAVALSAFSSVELSVPDSSLDEGGALNELHGPRAEA